MQFLKFLLEQMDNAQSLQVVGSDSVVKINAYAGKYYPGTHYDPPEQDEDYITDVEVELLTIDFSYGDKTFYIAFHDFTIDIDGVVDLRDEYKLFVDTIVELVKHNKFECRDVETDEVLPLSGQQKNELMQFMQTDKKFVSAIMSELANEDRIQYSKPPTQYD
jgi:hypothetical protein